MVKNGLSTEGSASVEMENSYCTTPMGPTHINDGVSDKLEVPSEGEFISTSDTEKLSTIE